MLRRLRRRLDRLWEAYRQRVAARAAHDAKARSDRDFAACLRSGLARAGIDPDTVPALRRYEAQIAAAAPPPAPPRRRSEDDAVAMLREKLLRIRACHRDAPLDLATASPMEVFAVYCFRPDLPGVSVAY